MFPLSQSKSTIDQRQATWKGLSMGWIGKCESKAAFHEVEDGNPVFAGTFQNNNVAIVLFEPTHGITNTVDHCGECHG